MTLLDRFLSWLTDVRVHAEADKLCRRVFVLKWAMAHYRVDDTAFLLN